MHHASTTRLHFQVALFIH